MRRIVLAAGVMFGLMGVAAQAQTYGSEPMVQAGAGYAQAPQGPMYRHPAGFVGYDQASRGPRYRPMAGRGSAWHPHHRDPYAMGYGEYRHPYGPPQTYPGPAFGYQGPGFVTDVAGGVADGVAGVAGGVATGAAGLFGVFGGGSENVSWHHGGACGCNHGWNF